MLIATIWRDLRWRLLAALLLVALPVMLVTWAYRSAPADPVHTPSYRAYVDTTWFDLPGPSAIFLIVAVIVSAAGRLMRPNGEVAYTLALPISRRRWLLMHAAASVAAVAVVQLVVDLALVAGTPHSGLLLLPLPLLARSLGVVFAAAAWVGVTIAALALVRYPVLAVTLVLGLVELAPGDRFRIELPGKPTSAMLSTWDPWWLADPRAWDGGVPTASVLVALVLGLGGLAVGMYRVERMDL
jgi:hypothetical protein